MIVSIMILAYCQARRLDLGGTFCLVIVVCRVGSTIEFRFVWLHCCTRSGARKRTKTPDNSLCHGRLSG
jgi:hypothetical protein